MPRSSFLKAVHDDPDDDTVRLAFADWLDENGNPARAEFIRTQIELTRTPPWTEKGIDLSVRERQLLNEHRRDWLAEIPKWVPRKGAVFARGFLTGIACPAAKYLTLAERLARHTTVQALRLTDLPPDAATALAATPHLARVRCLTLRDDSWRAVPTVLSSPHLGLCGLNLAGGRGDRDRLAETFRTLAALPGLGSLERLCLTVTRWHTDPPIPAEVSRAVAGLPLRRLRSLQLCVHDLDRGRLGEVLTSPAAAGLAELRLPGYLPASAALALRDGPELANLRAIEFGGEPGAEDSFADTFDSPVMRNVVALNTERACPHRTGQALAASPLAGRLRSLSAGFGLRAGSGGACLEKAGAFRELLDLRVRGGDDAGIRALAAAKGLGKLRHLDLSATAITPAALDALAASPNFPNLRAVTVSTALGPGNLDKPAVMRAFAQKYADRFTVLVWA